jgi:hypothetical protein
LPLSFEQFIMHQSTRILVGAHEARGAMAVSHCQLCWRWWSDILWVTWLLTRLWLHCSHHVQFGFAGLTHQLPSKSQQRVILSKLDLVLLKLPTQLPWRCFVQFHGYTIFYLPHTT